jgi:hypothetical protein
VAGDSNCRNCWLQSTGNYVGDYNGDGRYELLFLRSGAGNNHWFLGTINNNQLTCNEITGNGVGFADLKYAIRFQGRFSRSDREEILFYYPGDDNWWLGTIGGSNNQFNWVLVGNTRGFGHGINDGRPFYIGDFNGDKKSDVMFFFPGDLNWWLGTIGNNNQLNWTLAGNNKGMGNTAMLPTYVGRFFRNDREEFLFNWAGDIFILSYNGSQLEWVSNKPVSNVRGFGDISKLPTHIGDFNGDKKSEYSFYYGGDGNWWLGTFDGTQFHWNIVSNTKNEPTNFGDISKLPTWIGNMDGDNKADILFYYGGDGHWWLGPYDGTKIQWKLVSESAGFGNITSLPKWYADFNGDGKSDIVFYYSGDGHWWLGPYDGNKIQWTLVAADIISRPPPPPPPPTPQPQIVRLTLERTTQIPDATHVGALAGPGGIIKSVKNLEQFAWWLSHTDNRSPPTWYDARLEVGEIKTRPYNSGGWTGMYSNGEYRGNYGGSGPMPYSLHAEIEIQL